MTYSALPEVYRAGLLIFATVILIVFIYEIVQLAGHAGRKRYLLTTAFLFLVTFVLYQGMIMYHEQDIPSFDVPVILLLPLLLSMFVFTLLVHLRILRWRRQNITAMSVKEAVDRLPAGILCYTGDGIPVIVNESMHAVCRSLTGRPVTDAAALWEELAKRSGKEAASVQDPIIINDAGKAYSFQRNTVNINGAEVYEISVEDVTAEYELGRELAEARNRAEINNKRLKALMKSIDHVSMNRELLGLKSALHDNIGQSILIARRYLYSPDSVDRDRMLQFWQDNIRYLVSDENEKWELPYYAISREADSLGIHIDITGKLPTERHLIPVVDTAISVQIGNTLKHTDAEILFIRVNETKESYRICLTNGQKSKTDTVVEKGGLGSLRDEIRSVGGTMEIKTEPEFAIELTLPKKEGTE